MAGAAGKKRPVAVLAGTGLVVVVALAVSITLYFRQRGVRPALRQSAPPTSISQPAPSVDVPPPPAPVDLKPAGIAAPGGGPKPPVAVRMAPRPDSQSQSPVGMPAAPPAEPPPLPRPNPDEERPPSFSPGPATAPIAEVTTPAQPAPEPRPIPILRPEPAPLQPAEPSAVQPYQGPPDGTMIWTGVMGKNESVVIEGSRASAGSVRGELLPGVPVQIEVQPGDVAIAEPPGPSNAFRRLVIRSRTKRNTVVTVTWKVLR